MTTNDLTTTTPGAIQPQDIESQLAGWLDWLDLRVSANEISKATANSYAHGARRYLTFATGTNPAEPDTIRVWKAELLKSYKPRSINTWLAGRNAQDKLRSNPAYQGRKPQGTKQEACTRNSDG